MLRASLLAHSVVSTFSHMRAWRVTLDVKQNFSRLTRPSRVTRDGICERPLNMERCITYSFFGQPVLSVTYSSESNLQQFVHIGSFNARSFLTLANTLYTPPTSNCTKLKSLQHCRFRKCDRFDQVLSPNLKSGNLQLLCTCFPNYGKRNTLYQLALTFRCYLQT